MTTEYQRAQQRARKVYRSAGMRSVYAAGAASALRGDSRDSCPYRGGGGWRPAWRVAWLRGYDSVPPNEEET